MEKLKYTNIYIFYQDKVLLINRKNIPIMGMWCGIGGHIEDGEEIIQSAKRETLEESNIDNVELKIAGKYKAINSYVLYGRIDSNPTPEAFIMDEGLMKWFPVEWTLNPKNQGVNKETKNAIRDCLEKMKR